MAASVEERLAIPATDEGLPGAGPIRRYEWFQKLWLERRAADLLPVRYYHLVFTLPAAIAYANKAVVYDLLFRVSAETLLTIAADPKHLGAWIGMTSVLHTWGSALTHHPRCHNTPKAQGAGVSMARTP